YVESVRQDPDDPELMFAGTSRTVYFSLDGGAQWQRLSLNLPAVRISDIEIQPRQHAVVLATFGRAYWVLDNLQLLEQLGRTQVAATAPYLFQPQQAWLVSGGGGFGGRGNLGESLAPGAQVFFHLPSDYDGSTPVKLSFTNSSGQLVNSYTLPLAPAPAGRSGRAIHIVKLHPGMNRFLWNMRYPSATEVKGIFRYAQQNGELVGPEVVPGTYQVTLSYGGFRQKQSLVIQLDPNLQTTPAELQQRFDLLMRLHRAANRLDINLNRAIDARNALAKTAPAAARLDQDINSLVDLQIQAYEGSLVYPDLLRSWLWRISNRIDSSFLPPTSGMVQVANEYIQQADAGVARLAADLAAAPSTGR
ncbi:MAG: hypothetical protein ACRD2D_01510, partial [Terriglobales bacterium]